MVNNKVINVTKFKKFRNCGHYFRLRKRIISKRLDVLHQELILRPSETAEISIASSGPLNSISTFTDENILPISSEYVSKFEPCSNSESIYLQHNNDEYVDTESDEENYGIDFATNRVSIKGNFCELLKSWAITFNIRHTAVTGLLSLLQKVGIQNIPTSSRTLLQTARSITIVPMGSGQYWHQGIRPCLLNYFFNITKDKSIEINVNMDGLPVYNSSKIKFWPILCNIHNMPYFKPMVIGIYCGTSDPSNSFLKPFANEMKEILENGISINGYKINIRIRCIICDTPARALVKGIVNFNAYHGCIKCVITGEYYHSSHRMSFQRTDLPRRTDTSFRQRTDPDHHKERSPIEDLPINMVDDFPIADPLHLIDLGLMKRFLVGWRDGTFSHKTKWSAYEIKEITKFLLQCRMPVEIHRAIRGLDCLSFWKGLEFRTFFFYISPVILKDFLPYYVYQHFLLLFCAITICSNKEYFGYLDVAAMLLNDFIEKYIDIYGADTITSNVHNLCHLVDDVKRFGVLETISSYPFENMLHYIKCLLRTGNNPLGQAAKRISEIQNNVKTNFQSDQLFPILKKKINNRFTRIDIRDGLKLTTEMKDKWFLTKTGEIVQMKFATNSEKDFFLHGISLKNISPLFDLPIRSSYLNIFQSTCEENSQQIYTIDNIKCKLVALQYKDKTVFIPLLHTLFQSDLIQI